MYNWVIKDIKQHERNPIVFPTTNMRVSLFRQLKEKGKNIQLV